MIRRNHIVERRNHIVEREILKGARNLGSRGFSVDYIKDWMIKTVKERVPEAYQKTTFRNCWADMFC